MCGTKRSELSCVQYLHARVSFRLCWRENAAFGLCFLRRPLRTGPPPPPSYLFDDSAAGVGVDPTRQPCMFCFRMLVYIWYSGGGIENARRRAFREEDQSGGEERGGEEGACLCVLMCIFRRRRRSARQGKGRKCRWIVVSRHVKYWFCVGNGEGRGRRYKITFSDPWRRGGEERP